MWFASTARLFGHVLLNAHAVTAQPTELVELSSNAFERWPAIEPFRRFAFGVFAGRLTDPMALAEAVVFQRRTSAWPAAC